MDGGPRGHSVFTGRLIELLEATGDYITANEIQAILKERVYQDARARGHEQTPGFGALYGGGDFVFVPTNQDKLSNLATTNIARQQELDRLRKIESETMATKHWEQAEIIKKEAELAVLDKQIAEMKSRLGTTAARSSDSLDQLVALAEQKEQEGKGLDKLREKVASKKQEANFEIEQAQKLRESTRINNILLDLIKYEKIASSKYTQNMKRSAWDALVALYPETKDVPQFDVDKFKEKLGVPAVGSSRGSIGVNVQEITYELAKKLHFPDTKGVVSGVKNGGPSDFAGLVKGDVITNFNEQQIDTIENFANIAISVKKHELVRLTIRKTDGSFKIVAIKSE